MVDRRVIELLLFGIGASCIVDYTTVAVYDALTGLSSVSFLSGAIHVGGEPVIEPP